MSIYVMVRNPAGEIMSVKKESFGTFEEARIYRQELEAEYSRWGRHEVKLFLELLPPKPPLSPRDDDVDVEEEFDADEMEEEE